MPRKKMTTKGASAGDSMVDLAGPVSDRVQIRHVILAETVARRQPVCAGLPTDLSLHVRVTTEMQEQERLIQVLPRFTLVGRGTEGAAGATLHIEALFVVQYHVPSFEGLSRANIDAFGKLNGVYNVWPYWREYVQSVAVRMGLPPLTVPVFRPLAAGVQSKRAIPAPRGKSND